MNQTLQIEFLYSCTILRTYWKWIWLL